MAVSEQTPYKEYTANGSTNSFALEFDCENQDHLIVLVDDVEPVVGTWSLSDGAVVFSTVPANGKKITIQRNTPFRRDGDFQSYDNSFRPGSVNKGFDKVWLKLQELGTANWLSDTDIKNLVTYVNSLEQNTNAMLEDAIANGVASALAITVVENISELNKISKWDHRTVYVKDVANFKWDAADNEWVLVGNAASSLIDLSGQNQQEINDYVGSKWYAKDNGYPLNARIMLSDGYIVKSTIPSNHTNPNVDMAGWVKENSINNAQFHGCNPDGTDISTAFTNYANNLPKGSTVVLPEGEYYWDATSGTKSITNDVNFIFDGAIINVKPNASGLPFLQLKSDEVVQYNGAGILNSLNSFDPILQVKGSPLANPCDYFVVLRSTEVLIHRAGFTDDYKKEVTLDIIDNSYRLRSPPPITYNDLSKLTVSFVKKSRPTTLKNLRVKPTELTPNDGYMIQYAYKYGVETENLVIDMQGKESVAVGIHYLACSGLRFKNSGVIGANSDTGTSYAFLNSASSHAKFEGCFYRDSGGAIKKERGHVGRHGFNIEFDSCFFSGVDDHYGWNYFVKNMQMSRGIQFAGGSLTVENCYSSDILVSLREDTPYADGTLKIINSFGRTHTLKAYGHTSPTATTGDFTSHKVWDVIDIDFDIYSDQISNSAIVIKEPYTGQTDVYRDTILNIRGSLTERLGIYRTLLDIWLQTNNTTGVEVPAFSGDLASKKLFSQVNIDVKHNKIINGLTANTNDFIRGAVADEHNFKSNDLHFIQVRSGVLNIEASQFKDSRYVNNMSTDVAEINLCNTRFKTSAKTFILNKTTHPNVKVYLDNIRAPNQNTLWTMFGDNIEYSKSIFDDESYKAANTWNLRGYRKGLQYEFATTSDITLAANEKSVELFFTWLSATRYDFKQATILIPGGLVGVEVAYNPDLFDDVTKFKLINKGGTSVTIPTGTKVRFKLI